VVVNDEAFPRRAEAARRTHAAIVRAAGELFGDRGYASTTITGIAERAGVGRSTVFTAVPGGKPALLSLARDLALAGDDEPVPIRERAWFRDAMAAETQRELLRRQAANLRAMQARAARLEEVLAQAASEVAELAELHRRAERQRWLGARTVVDRLGELGPLRDATEQAADVYFALASPGVYLLLTRDRGWSAERYESWLAAALQDALLPADRRTGDTSVEGR